MEDGIDSLRRRMVPVPDGRYLIGLSGGADSVCLVRLLWPDIRDGRIRAEAVHVNHGLRGEESDGDESFCASFCEKLGIPFTSFHAELRGRKDEAAAREARYRFFRRRAAETEADGLLLAHNADDQAETFLMRLLRGAGPEGLACMREDETVGGLRILRPMLGLRREEIRDALRAGQTGWREDSSNGDLSYLRNRVRLELIPFLERFSGTAVEKIRRASELIGEDQKALGDMAGEWLERLSGDGFLDAETLSAEPPALRRRVLRQWWRESGPLPEEHALSAAQTEALEKLLLSPRGRLTLPGGRLAVRTGKYLFLTNGKEPRRDPVPVRGKESRFGDYVLRVSPTEGNAGDGKGCQEVPAEFLRGCVIRTRRPGDRIRPFGSAGSRKLQDYLTDRKIPEPFRDRIPLLCREGEVLLVCGVGAGQVPAWHPQEANVRLTWLGDMPWRQDAGKGI